MRGEWSFPDGGGGHLVCTACVSMEFLGRTTGLKRRSDDSDRIGRLVHHVPVRMDYVEAKL